jgi:hypothetical protein
MEDPALKKNEWNTWMDQPGGRRRKGDYLNQQRGSITHEMKGYNENRP